MARVFPWAHRAVLLPGPMTLRVVQHLAKRGVRVAMEALAGVRLLHAPRSILLPIPPRQQQVVHRDSGSVTMHVSQPVHHAMGFITPHQEAARRYVVLISISVPLRTLVSPWEVLVPQRPPLLHPKPNLKPLLPAVSVRFGKMELVPGPLLELLTHAVMVEFVISTADV